MREKYGIHWFRRDLRIAGNSALQRNWKENQGRTVGVFFFDSQFLGRPDFSYHRFGFFLQTLKKLKEELSEMGSDLLVLDSGPEQGFELLFQALKEDLPSVVTFNRDYEPFARDRDQRGTQKMIGRRIEVHTERDHLVLEPHEIRKDSSSTGFYQIYTPFAKKWFSLLSQSEMRERIESQEGGVSYLEKREKGKKIDPFFRLKWKDLLPASHFQDSLDLFIRKNESFQKIKLPEAGSLAAFQVAKSFRSKVDDYLEKRDYPSISGTSHLSVYLKNGSITPAMVLKILNVGDSRQGSQAKSLGGLEWGEKSGRNHFLKEIVWREFYYHILFHQPSVEKEAFIKHYRNIQWENNEKWFEAWKEGRTGYPIVDAGMRQMKTTGWMHNRVRMIVASFLTKDLLIDWRWGEKHFMNELLDGDLAPNNGGWQWAASTGCDPQPYFRIFNPILQGEKFDPQADYIREYVPELKHESAEKIHSLQANYIRPIVDHKVQKEKAIQLFKACSK